MPDSDKTFVGVKSALDILSDIASTTVDVGDSVAVRKMLNEISVRINQIKRGIA